MSTELRILGLGSVLLLVHIFIPAIAKTRQYGVAWNAGPRDEVMPPLNALAGRLVRAQINFQETFPIAIVALLGAALANRASELSAIGGWIWLGARVLYLPLYAGGVPKVRSAVFLVSLVGLGLAISPLIFG